MAIKRTSSNSISNAVKLSTGFSSAAIPNSPTIGTATATSDVAATVTYTAAVLGATGSTFTATSNPGSVTGTGSSPITVTGLTASTSYTFSVTAGNANGTSAASSASNSITTDAPLGSFESIATVTVGAGGASSISFTSIPATFTHLQLRYFSLNTNNDTTVFRVNGDTGSNYSLHVMNGSGSSPVTTGGTVSYSFGSFGVTSGVANTFAAGIVDFLDYANTNKYKTIRGLSGRDWNGSGNIQIRSSLWNSTSAITSITTTTDSGHNFTQYTKFALYGIKGA